MTSTPERNHLLELIDEAVRNGARIKPACAEAGIGYNTWQRWNKAGPDGRDGRPGAHRPTPSHALTEEERQEILRVCNEPIFASKPPSQIVPTLLDEGVWIASVSSFYRVLKHEGQLNHRGRHIAPERRGKATTHHATAANQCWCWDVTWLPSRVKGRFYYLYTYIDLFSRKIVGWEVHDKECGELAAELLTRVVRSEGVWNQPPVVHSDNGSPMKSITFTTKMNELGVMSSFSRPRVSNDNAYIESFFRTAKYCPLWPSRSFETLEQARGWVQQFVAWYNTEHKHSALKFVTPEQKHKGDDIEILKARQAHQEAARKARPDRWSTRARDWSPVTVTTLNPERNSDVKERGLMKAA